MSALLPVLGDALSPYLDFPYALFGHSLGGLVVFELARLFRRREEPMPVHLFISGHLPPQIPRSAPQIHDLPEAEFLQELPRYTGTSNSILENPEVLQLAMPALRADFSLLETYQYSSGHPLPCPISAFGGAQDSTVNPHQLSGWQDETNSYFRLEMFAGDHFFVNTDQRNVTRALSSHLSDRLRELGRP
jgi:medium-chain acyl-[acyl-carrier-protein] hydrolase